MLLHAAKRTNLSETVKDQLVHLIASGAVPPGGRLPSETELCRQLGVGRTSLREAIRVLHALGLIEVRQGKGTYVRKDANQPVPFSAWPAAFNYTVGDVSELRLAIEPRAARLAALRRDPSDLAAIETALVRMDEGIRARDVAVLALADWHFHERVVEASKNPFFMDVMKRTAHVQIENFRSSWIQGNWSRRALELHYATFEHIRLGDPNRAAASMTTVLLNWADEMGLGETPARPTAGDG